MNTKRWVHKTIIECSITQYKQYASRVVLDKNKEKGNEIKRNTFITF